ncbi:unnamed protein product [Closterium sp. Naga37s-1]|nr:unnamed protein product [Closterium sp. Naga37s-1]
MAARHRGATRYGVDPEGSFRAWRSFFAELGDARSPVSHESQARQVPLPHSNPSLTSSRASLLPLSSFRSPPSAPLLPRPSFHSSPLPRFASSFPPPLPPPLSAPSPYSSSGSFRPFLRPFALGALMGSLLVAISLLSANPPRAGPSAAGAGTLGGAGARGDGASGANDMGRGEEELFSRGGGTDRVVTSNVVTMSSSGGALDAVDSLPGLSEGFGLTLTDLEQSDPTRLALQLSNRQLAALMADVAQWRARSGVSMDGVLGAAMEELHTLLAPPSAIQLVSPTSLPLLLSFLRPPNASNHPTAAALSASLTTLLPIKPASVSSLTAAAAASSGNLGGGVGGGGGGSEKAGREGGVWRGGGEGMGRCMALMCQVERQQMMYAGAPDLHHVLTSTTTCQMLLISPPLTPSPLYDSHIICCAPSVHTAAREEYEDLVRERRAWEVVGLHREWVEARREWMGPARNTMEALQRLMAMPPGSGIFRKLFEYIFWLRPYAALYRSVPTPALSSVSSLRLSSIHSSISLDGRQAASTLNAARSSLLSSLGTLSSRCGVDASGEFWTDMHDAALQRYRWVAESAFDKWCVDWAAVGGEYRQHAGLVVPGEVWRREGLHEGGMEKDIDLRARGMGGSESERDLERQRTGGDKGVARAEEGGRGTGGARDTRGNREED